MNPVPRPNLIADTAAPRRPQAPAPSGEALLHQLSAQQEELRTQNAQLTEAQDLLQETLAEYTDLYDHAPVGFVTLDANGLILRMNAAAEELIRARRERLSGLTFRNFVREGDGPAFREHLRRCRTGEPRVSTELALSRSDGREVPAELISRPAEGEGGRTFRTAIIDLTERKRAEARTATLTAELERRTAEAEQYAGRLRALAAKLSDAETAERRRLARNLHDHLQQELIGAKYCVALAGGPGPGPVDAAKLGEVAAAIDRCLESSRQITADLTPPPLQQGAGLPAALRWLADRTQERHGLKVAVEVAADGDPASDAVRTMLYEAARELLLNVVKHAGVGEAKVSLSRLDGGRLRLCVSDAGAGFELTDLLDRSDAVTGLGLFGMRERVEGLGGGLMIRSGPGGGTAVTIEAPDRQETPGGGEAARRTNLGQVPR